MPGENTAPTTGQDLVSKTREYLQKKQLLPQATPGNPVAVTAGVTPPTTTPSTPLAVSVKGMTSVVDALYTKGIISQDQLKSIKFESVTSGANPTALLLSKGLVSEIQLQQLQAEMYGIGFIDLNSVTIQSETLNRLPKDVAMRNMAVVFEENNAKVKVAMQDPLDLQKVKFIEGVVGKPVDSYYATAQAIQAVVDTKYGAQIGNVVDRALEDIGVVDINADDAAQANFDSSVVEGAPVAKIVNMILDYGIKHEASDIHIEPRENRVAVRYRVHGILAEKLTLPSKLANSVVARIKILANMKIDEHRIPQDNRFQVKANELSVDVRVSIMPSVYGEKVVMRLLERDKGIIDINKVGMRGPALRSYIDALAKTQGIILITGPTGSGKTVTLASSLNKLNTQEVNILTLEDPVEIRINGITQVQVNPDVGLSFANGLRAFLRQDPDVIMVGEIRDGETASLAVQAALTGHLVLATLHTNSAAGSLPRLLDIGVEPYLLSSTIIAVVAQRLVRSLCNECKQEYEAPEHVVQMLHEKLDSLHGFDLFDPTTKQKIHFDSDTRSVKLYKPVGCPKCGGEGYDGRIGMFEVMTMTENLAKLVMNSSTSQELQRQAEGEGMINMMQDGFMKSMEGMTTIEEVLRVQNS